MAPIKPSPAKAPVAPTSAAPPPAPAATTTGPTEYISIPLAAITTGWPEPIRHALAGLNAPDATLQLPAAETEQALKRGKVVFPWKRLKSLVRPPLKTALAPALDELQLELPLPAIAPLFMAQRKNATVQRKYDVGADIPDVFSGRGLAAAHAPPTAPAAPGETRARSLTTTEAPGACAPRTDSADCHAGGNGPCCRANSRTTRQGACPESSPAPCRGGADGIGAP